MNKEKCLEIRQ